MLCWMFDFTLGAVIYCCFLQCVGWTEAHLATKKGRLEVFWENNLTNQGKHRFFVTWISEELIMKRGLFISAWWAATPDRNVTRRTRKISVSICSFPSVPSSLCGLHGICGFGGRGGGVRGWDRAQRRSRLTNQNESGETLTKHPDSRVFYLQDRLMKQNGQVCRFFACSGMAKGWAGKTESEKIEKRPMRAFICSPLSCL